MPIENVLIRHFQWIPQNRNQTWFVKDQHLPGPKRDVKKLRANQFPRKMLKTEGISGSKKDVKKTKGKSGSKRDVKNCGQTRSQERC